MLRSIFNFNLNEQILPEKVAIGKFDGTHPSLVAATSNDKVSSLARNHLLSF